MCKGDKPHHNMRYFYNMLPIINSDIDTFHEKATGLLDKFYPERTISVTDHDPEFITADIKAKLRHKNRLMHAGRLDEANALAQLIGKEIKRKGQASLSNIDSKTDIKQMWQAVCKLTGRTQQTTEVTGITADSLNQHYASISDDPEYHPPSSKLTTMPKHSDCISEWQVFKALDKLKPTATGLDRLPAWFLRLGAPLFAKPLASLFNYSLACLLYTSPSPRD